MDIRELAVDADRAANGEGQLRLESNGKVQPLVGIRGKLLCVNSRGNAVYLYSKKQARRVAEKAFAIIGREAVYDTSVNNPAKVTLEAARELLDGTVRCDGDKGGEDGEASEHDGGDQGAGADGGESPGHDREPD